MKLRPLLLIALVILGQLSPFLSTALSADAQPAQAVADGDDLRRCHDLTKGILLAVIELERFSLRYRLASLKTSRLVLLQFFAGHEAGAAGSLASGIISTSELESGRRNPRLINSAALRRGFRASEVTSILSGSSAAVALAWNMAQAYRNHKLGFSSAQANRYVQAHLTEIDRMLDERDKIVQSHPEHRFAAVAMREGKILRQLRDGCFFEYATFNRNVRNNKTSKNVFYALNVATNVLAATAAHYAIKATKEPRVKGSAAILAVVTGAMTMASPLLATAAGIGAGRWAWRSHSERSAGRVPDYSPEKLIAEANSLNDELKLLDPADRELASAIARSELYLTSSEHFRKELENETRALSSLSKVAEQSTLFGPVVGSMVMTRGILATVGFYEYRLRPRKELNLNYKGAVVGTVGSGVALGVTTGALILGIAYLRHLKKTHRLPTQLIEDQLKHLDTVEQSVRSL